MGGIILASLYLASMYPSEREKLLTMDGQSTFKKMKFEDDLDIETKKTYLVYLADGDAVSKEDAYAIIGFQGELSEIETPLDYSKTYTSVEDNQNLKIYNNYTKEWENLGDIVK